MAGICARASAVFFAILFATCLTTPQVAQAQGKAAVAQARTPAGSDWAQLHATQRQALQPLAAHWTQLSEGQKRKWIALSKNYANMTVDEQTKLRGRMTEWVALTPQQRSQARLNFAESKAATLSPGDKKAKWEAYQSLSPEQKRRLAAQVPPKTRGAAGVVKPVPAEKLSPPAHRAATAATAPAQPALSIDHNTAPSKHTAD